MKVLITGGCGFVGSNAAIKFIERGHEVIAFDNLSRKGSEFNLEELKHLKGFHFIMGDIRKMEDFDQIPEVDGIIHTAAQPGVPTSINDPRYDFEVNAQGTFNVLEYARREKTPTIFCSTNKCYSCEINNIRAEINGDRRVWPEKYVNGIPEDFPVGAGGKAAYSPYGCSKYLGDRYCQEYFNTYGVPTVVNRMSCIAGERQMGFEEQGWLAWFVYARIFDLRVNIYGDGKQVRDVLYVGDLADLFLEELTNIEFHKGQVYNIGGGPENAVSLIEVLDHLVALDGSTFLTTYQDWRPADHLIYISDIRKISKYWEPKVGAIETVDKIWNWANIPENKSKIWKMLQGVIGGK